MKKLDTEVRLAREMSNPGNKKMQSIRIFQVDAFADSPFTGNPAAVCLLEDWPGNELLQSVSAENNLAETAFLMGRDGYYEIRWFTPTVEVELCGHATLASAYVLLEVLKSARQDVTFQNRAGDVLRVFRKGELFVLDFPAASYNACDPLSSIVKGIGKEPSETYSGREFHMAVMESEEDVARVNPDLGAIASLDGTGLIVTAPGRQVDFVSRFFAPQSGINEDPVTGSAHTLLIPYWSRRLKKNSLKPCSFPHGAAISIAQTREAGYTSGDVHAFTCKGKYSFRTYSG